MPVQSAQELHELVSTLSTQFSQIHQQAAKELHTLADQHIQHVQDEAQQWITAELSTLLQEWLQHKAAIQQAEQWFEQHAPHLQRVAEDAAKLAQESFA